MSPPVADAPAPEGLRPAWGGPAPATPTPTQRHIAVVDGGSFVLPYVHGLVTALRERGHRATVYASRTRYNGEFLDALRGVHGVEVVDVAVSGTVAPRWRGGLAYASLLFTLWQRRRQYDTINLQFSVLWPLELPLAWGLRRRLVYTVHNAVPHGHRGLRHRPTEWLAGCARALLFASQATHDDFLRRYGERWRERSTVVPHGLLPLAPHDGATPYRAPFVPRALVYWSTVKPYKGVELFAELARSAALKQRGLALEVHGAWSPTLHGLKRELAELGVTVDDAYLGAVALRRLFARDVVFVLPYRDASQSGALYTLLSHGCVFICADVGDLGDFMRRFGLEGLLLHERSADAVLACLDHLQANGPAVHRAFAAAQARSRWSQAMATAWPVYEVRP